MLDATKQLDEFCAQYLFKSALPANISVIAGSSLASIYFYREAGDTLITWIALMMLTASSRILISNLFFIDQKKNFIKRTTRQWINIYTVSTLVCGSCWASLIFFIPLTNNVVNISMVYIVYFAVMAGSITALPVVLKAFYLYITPVFIAAFGAALFITSKESLYIAAASVIYYLFIIAAGRLLHKRYIQNFSLHIENETLISKLHEEIIQKELAEQKLINNQLTLEETVDLRTKELIDINDVLVDEINERRRIESNLKHIAHHDTLTNLPNRLLLDARLNHAIERAKRSNLQVAVIFIDLDHFKTINDSLGHAAGDELLIAISKRLLNCVREDDTVARLSGDEFIVIIEQVHDIGDLHHLLKKIMKATSENISIRDHEVRSSASLGISIYPDDGDSAEKLMRNADAAMYHVKEHGRHKYHFYTRELTTAAYDRVILETDLNQALEGNQLVVYYQPQVSLKSKKIIGVEALIRWNHPELGILTPEQFLHIAEQSNQINRIGEFVLTTACAQMVSWKQLGIPIETVAVNIAGNQIHHSRLLEKVQYILQQTHCKTEWLELEITEDFILKKTKQAIATLEELRDLGLSLAIDDFGTGYSSLSYLKQLPISKLKIDRSFIHDINEDKDDATLVQAIIAMGKSLNLKLIAEGVESTSHEEFLLALGCDFAQGYLYSKPVPAEEIQKMFSAASKSNVISIK